MKINVTFGKLIKIRAREETEVWDLTSRCNVSSESSVEKKILSMIISSILNRWSAFGYLFEGPSSNLRDIIHHSYILLIDVELITLSAFYSSYACIVCHSFRITICSENTKTFLIRLTSRENIMRTGCKTVVNSCLSKWIQKVDLSAWTLSFQIHCHFLEIYSWLVNFLQNSKNISILELYILEWSIAFSFVRYTDLESNVWIYCQVETRSSHVVIRICRSYVTTFQDNVTYKIFFPERKIVPQSLQEVLEYDLSDFFIFRYLLIVNLIGTRQLFSWNLNLTMRIWVRTTGNENSTEMGKSTYASIEDVNLDVSFDRVRLSSSTAKYSSSRISLH